MLKFGRDGVELLFKKQDKSEIKLRDTCRMLPAYACTVKYKLDIDRESGDILNCVFAEKMKGTTPLKVARVRSVLRTTNFSPQTLSRQFKGRGRDEYNNERQLVEHISNAQLKKCLLILFDRHFQPDSYYFVGCYLTGPELLDKNEAELKKLTNLLAQSPSSACFLSRYVTESAVVGVNDLSYSAAIRLSENIDKDKELIRSSFFPKAVTLYQRCLSERKKFGFTMHIIPKEQQDEGFSYLLSQQLIVAIDESDNTYMLGFVSEFGDGAIADCMEQLLERVPEDERRRTAISTYSYEPSCMPVLLIRHCGSNHYDTLKALIEDWEADKDRLHRGVCVLCESTYYAARFENEVDMPALVYRQGSPPNVDSSVGLVIIERCHLWDSVLLGRLLLSLKTRWDNLNFIFAGDDREMPVSIGAGSIFTDLYQSKLFPVIYETAVAAKPTVITTALNELLLRGGLCSAEERAYGDLVSMTQSQWKNTEMQNLRSKILAGCAVRLLCDSQQQKLEIYDVLRREVWGCAEGWKSNFFYFNEAVYSCKLMQSLFAAEVLFISKSWNKAGVCHVKYERSSKNFPCRSHPTEFTTAMMLKDHFTQLMVPVSLSYEEGLYPSTVHLYSQSQSYCYNDISYLFIDRNTAWRVIYTTLVKTTQRLILVYPDDCQLNDTLDHILENNWKKYGRRGALGALLKLTARVSRKRQCV